MFYSKIKLPWTWWQSIIQIFHWVNNIRIGCPVAHSHTLHPWTVRSGTGAWYFYVFGCVYVHNISNINLNSRPTYESLDKYYHRKTEFKIVREKKYCDKLNSSLKVRSAGNATATNKFYIFYRIHNFSSVCAQKVNLMHCETLDSVCIGF